MCATGYGIRRSKDLRARSRKFLNLTNERKNMSTKTNFKRVALVAVASLGLGVLTSVAPANAAAGVFGAITGNVTTNACSALDADGAVAADFTQASNVTYLTVPVGTTITFTGTAAAQEYRIGGDAGVGLFTSSTADATTEVIISRGGTLASVQAAVENTDTFSITAQAVGDLTLKSYDDAADSTAADSIYVTVVASCATGTFSLSKSKVELQTTYSAADTLIDEAVGTTDGKVLYLSTRLNNGYSAAMPAGTWVVQATGDAVVGISTANSAPTCGAVNLAAAVDDGDYVNVAVCQGTDYAPWAGNITISYNGKVLVTKSAAITGDLASIKVSSPTIAKAGGVTTYLAFVTTAYDSAGNLVSVDPAVVSTTLNQYVTNVVAPATSASDVTIVGNGVTCGLLAGSAKVKLYAANNAGAYIYSNEWEHFCAGGTYTYTASMDKASYQPGDLATVTITAKDSKGNLVYGAGADAAGDTAADSARSNLLGATTLHSVAGSNLDPVVAMAAGDAFVNGVKTYKFKVGQYEGSYQMVVSLPDVATDSAKTIAYTVKSASTAVSNADVLKAIVSLIASINKQIAALQKALLKK